MCKNSGLGFRAGNSGRIFFPPSSRLPNKIVAYGSIPGLLLNCLQGLGIKDWQLRPQETQSEILDRV